MLQHLEARERRTAVVTAPENLSTKASKAQGRGVMNLFLDSESYLYHDELSVTPPQSPETPVRMLPTPQRPALNMFASSSYASSPSKSASESLHREAIVNAEHERYISDKVLPLSELGRTDLVKHWKVRVSLLEPIATIYTYILPLVIECREYVLSYARSRNGRTSCPSLVCVV
jgi:hypothetical protein